MGDSVADTSMSVTMNNKEIYINKLVFDRYYLQNNKVNNAFIVVLVDLLTPGSY